MAVEVPATGRDPADEESRWTSMWEPLPQQWSQTIWLIWAVLATASALLNFVVVYVIFRSRRLRRSAFNQLITGLAIPSVAFSGLNAALYLLNFFNGHHVGGDISCNVQSVCTMYGFTATIWMNVFFSHELHRMASCPVKQVTYRPLKLYVCIRRTVAIHIGAAVFSLTELIPILPVHAQLHRGLSCLPMEVDLPSAIYHWAVTINFVLVIPVLAILFNFLRAYSFLFRRDAGVKDTGLAMFFIRLFVVFIATWVPVCVLTWAVRAPGDAAAFVSIQGITLSHVQGIASALLHLRKRDLRSEVTRRFRRLKSMAFGAASGEDRMAPWDKQAYPHEFDRQTSPKDFERQTSPTFERQHTPEAQMTAIAEVSRSAPSWNPDVFLRRPSLARLDATDLEAANTAFSRQTTDTEPGERPLGRQAPAWDPDVFLRRPALARSDAVEFGAASAGFSRQSVDLESADDSPGRQTPDPGDGDTGFQRQSVDDLIGSDTMVSFVRQASDFDNTNVGTLVTLVRQGTGDTNAGQSTATAPTVDIVFERQNTYERQPSPGSTSFQQYSVVTCDADARYSLRSVSALSSEYRLSATSAVVDEMLPSPQQSNSDSADDELPDLGLPDLDNGEDLPEPGGWDRQVSQETVVSPNVTRVVSARSMQASTSLSAAFSVRTGFSSAVRRFMSCTPMSTSLTEMSQVSPSQWAIDERMNQIRDETNRMIFAKELQPMVVIELSMWLSIGHFPRSSEGTTRPLRPSDTVVFISHRWWGAEQPDDEKGNKYTILCSGLTSLVAKHKLVQSNVVIWCDWACIDQDDAEAQSRGISSLISYAARSSYILIPVMPTDAASKRALETASHPGSIPNYGERAWCRLEHYMFACVAEILEKAFECYAMGPQTSRFWKPRLRSFAALRSSKEVFFDLSLLPSSGTLTMEADRGRIREMEEDMRSIYAHYAIMKQRVKLLTSSTRLRSCILNQKQVSCVDMVLLTDVLLARRIAPRLCEVSLDGNLVAADGVAHLMTEVVCAPETSALRKLSLSNNPRIGKEGIGYIAHSLQDPFCCLEKLHLSRCNLSDEDVKVFATTLDDSPSIRLLDLSHNKITDPSVEAILMACQSSSGDSEYPRVALDVEGTNISVGVFQRVSAAASAIELGFQDRLDASNGLSRKDMLSHLGTHDHDFQIEGS